MPIIVKTKKNLSAAPPGKGTSSVPASAPAFAFSNEEVPLYSSSSSPRRRKKRAKRKKKATPPLLTPVKKKPQAKKKPRKGGKKPLTPPSVSAAGEGRQAPPRVFAMEGSSSSAPSFFPDSGGGGSAGSLSLTGPHPGGDTTSLTRESKTKVVTHPLLKEDHSLPASFVLLIGPSSLMGRHWTMNQKEMTVGRSRRNDICIQDPSISKSHFVVRLTDKEEKVCIQDKGSTNGLIVNHQPIPSEREVILKDKDQIQVGNVVLKFLDRGNPELVFVSSQFKRSFQDNLTRVGNRALLECRAPEMFKLSRQNQKPLSVIIFDVDHFKNVNDTYGHPTGDFVLKEVAGLARSCFRPRDLLTRSGGEEFCILLNMPLDKSRECIERVRTTVARHKFHFESQCIRISISAGLSLLKPKDESWMDIYKRADKALYQSKTGGRNRVCVL